MKKVLLTLMVVSLVAFTSCKKASKVADGAADAVENTAGDVADAANSAVDAGADAVNSVADAASNLFGADFTMPTFESEEAKTWADSLIQAANEVKTASTTGDNAALTTATTKYNEIVAKAKDFAGTPDIKAVTELVQKSAAAL